MSFYTDLVLTPEEEEEIITRTAEQIHKTDMDFFATLLFESIRPLVWIGGEMGRYFVTPMIPLINESWGIKSEKFLRVFEQRSNVEKLLKKLEQMNEDDKRRKKEEKEVEEAAQKVDEDKKADPKVS